ncbi:ABC-three component system middle component 2 [Methylobacterium indicum]|uniref:ABC-three component system middle component 2 n=1 Tax=Methylobacterium indicum TaxID=1775910 RepID=UPI001A970B2F|nr:ABC-three component system middle component 2 [Methylobacterium indicum]
MSKDPTLPHSKRRRPERLFNTPLECGFRLLFVLSACRPESHDVQRLISYDYLLVHSGDVSDMHASLHPATPNRGNEWVIKRRLVQSGLHLMFARELLEKKLTHQGILFSGTELTSAFINLLHTPYAQALRRRSEWLISTFGDFSDDELHRFMTAHIGRWGTEFESMSAIKDLEL